jgi:hypothetical protein
MVHKNNDISKLVSSQVDLDSDLIIKIPKWFIAVALIALLWNLIGVLAFISQVTMSVAALEQLPKAEQALYINMPLWANAAFAIAVFAGTTASFMLVCKMSWTVHFYMLSLSGIIVQFYHLYVIEQALDILGIERLVLPITVLLLAIALLLFSMSAKRKCWLK